jgi:hypothetical protein
LESLASLFILVFFDSAVNRDVLELGALVDSAVPIWIIRHDSIVSSGDRFGNYTTVVHASTTYSPLSSGQKESEAKAARVLELEQASGVPDREAATSRTRAYQLGATFMEAKVPLDVT